MMYPETKTHRVQAYAGRVRQGSDQQGLTLIELLISLVLGLVLVVGVLNIFVSTNQTSKVNNSLMRVQENTRAAFDLMARDIREAGQNPCGSKMVANVLRSSGAIPVWADWNAGTVRGYDNTQNEAGIKAFGTTNAARVSGTDAVLVIRTDQDEKLVNTHAPESLDDDVKTLLVLTEGSSFKENDIAFACDDIGAAIFQVYSISPASGTLKGMNLDYRVDGTNMNSSNLLNYPAPPTATLPSPPPLCPNPDPDPLCQNDPICRNLCVKQFRESGGTLPSGIVAKLQSSFWYVGNNSSGTRSLYRSIITRSGTGGTTIIMTADEVIPEVQDLQITYLTKDAAGTLATNWVNADAVANWSDNYITNTADQVVAVRLDLTLQTSDKVSTSQTPIQRHLIHVIELRNRATFIAPP